MTGMRTATGMRALRRRARAHTNGLSRAAHAGLALAALGATAAALSGCATGHPQPISARALGEAQTFPYYRIYWVGRSFGGQPLAAVDGQKSYNSSLGDSVYYGDCVHGKGVFGGGSCLLPLQVTTVIYRLHSNETLGPQRNVVVRGVPATVYDEGRSIEIYSGRVAIDLFSYDFSHAWQAALELEPLNAPGSARGNLPPPVYCPGLSGAMDAQLRDVLASLPGRACQKASAAVAFANSLA
jgi:hypothetical protein